MPAFMQGQYRPWSIVTAKTLYKISYFSEFSIFLIIDLTLLFIAVWPFIFSQPEILVALFRSRCLRSLLYGILFCYESINFRYIFCRYCFSYLNCFPSPQDLLAYRDFLLRHRNTHWNNKRINKGLTRIPFSRIFGPYNFTGGRLPPRSKVPWTVQGLHHLDEFHFRLLEISVIDIGTKRLKYGRIWRSMDSCIPIKNTDRFGGPWIPASKF